MKCWLELVAYQMQCKGLNNHICSAMSWCKMIEQLDLDLFQNQVQHVTKNDKIHSTLKNLNNTNNQSITYLPSIIMYLDNFCWFQDEIKRSIRYAKINKLKIQIGKIKNI